MEYRHIMLTELEQQFREIYKAARIEYAVEQPTVRPNAVPDTIVVLIKTEKPNVGAGMTVEIQSPSTVAKPEIPSTIVNQHIDKLLPTGFSRAQPESEHTHEEEACAGEDFGADYRFPVL
jgi:hypothetical protein